MAGIANTGPAARYPSQISQAANNKRATQTIGGWLALIGGLLALVANGLHPHPSSFDLQALLAEIAGSNAWMPIHLTLIAAMLLILGAMAAITLTLEGEPGATLARFALVAALVGGALSILVSTSMDGFAMKQVAQRLAERPCV